MCLRHTCTLVYLHGYCRQGKNLSLGSEATSTSSTDPWSELKPRLWVFAQGSIGLLHAMGSRWWSSSRWREGSFGVEGECRDMSVKGCYRHVLKLRARTSTHRVGSDEFDLLDSARESVESDRTWLGSSWLESVIRYLASWLCVCSDFILSTLLRRRRMSDHQSLQAPWRLAPWQVMEGALQRVHQFWSFAWSAWSVCSWWPGAHDLL